MIMILRYSGITRYVIYKDVDGEVWMDINVRMVEQKATVCTSDENQKL